MLERFRTEFNANFEVVHHQKLLQEIESEFPGQLDFKVSETPVFIDREFKTKLLIEGNTVIDFLTKPNFKELTEKAIPDQFRFANEGDHPDFLCIDYAVSKDENGVFKPELVELQGFPTLLGWQHYLAGKYKKHYKPDASLSPFFNRINAFNYITEVGKYLKKESGETVLLEYKPADQKTRIDFKISELYWGFNTVCLTSVFQKGSDLYYLKEDQEIKIDTIYNRVIFEELPDSQEIKKQVSILQSSNVEWLTNPNWYYRVSKYCLPLIKSKTQKKSFFLTDFEDWDQLSKYVLKPIFSFGGQGVNLKPTKEDLDAIPDPENYILQERIEYAPCVKSVDLSETKAEIRMIYIWPKNHSRPKLITSLARLSKDEMMNSGNMGDFWTGASAVYFETN
ncbi:hypothetical protein [Jiulongibacter sp. NS-SX5]|uniref:hypothetical protein n=1 Tax=Jiulongibacter sp. NS-SX5 TaxID=3463854 RepID=UPI0040595AC9